MSKFLLKYPTKGRPKQFLETLGIWQRRLSGKHEYQWIISIDKDDPTMCNPEMCQRLTDRPNLVVVAGDNKTKIQAINADIDKAKDFDIAVLVSDDMIPLNGSFDDIIAEDMQKHFPDLDGALAYSDGFRLDRLICLSIMGRELFKRFDNRFYWAEYRSVWSDNEFTEIVYREQKVARIDKVIIEHQWMKNGNDATYQKCNVDFEPDKQIYLRRYKDGFPGGIKSDECQQKLEEVVIAQGQHDMAEGARIGQEKMLNRRGLVDV